MPHPSHPLERDPDRAMLGGVCAGVADWLGWDATLVRVLAIVLMLLTSVMPFVVGYVLLWLVMPEKGAGDSGEPF